MSSQELRKFCQEASTSSKTSNPFIEFFQQPYQQCFDSFILEWLIVTSKKNQHLIMRQVRRQNRFPLPTSEAFDCKGYPVGQDVYFKDILISKFKSINMLLRKRVCLYSGLTDFHMLNHPSSVLKKVLLGTEMKDSYTYLLVRFIQPFTPKLGKFSSMILLNIFLGL
ncbi:hypothetical protein STEG23_014765 [Scotinomys teguina]